MTGISSALPGHSRPADQARRPEAHVPSGNKAATTPERLRSDRAMDAAQKLEATFLAEMLKSAGFGKTGAFSGGIGEEQFASLQTQALADKIARTGGLGLADTFYRSMMETNYDT